MAEGRYSLRRKAAETDRTLRQEAVRRAKQKVGGDNLLFVRATANAAAVWFDAAARLPNSNVLQLQNGEPGLVGRLETFCMFRC
ncbi:hypothetical protein DIPPA_15610 [Diplonema papillatum]|nr:hypothetical protein DIPPA_15610 [Diplonema papillatum]